MNFIFIAPLPSGLIPAQTSIFALAQCNQAERTAQAQPRSKAGTPIPGPRLPSRPFCALTGHAHVLADRTGRPSRTLRRELRVLVLSVGILGAHRAARFAGAPHGDRSPRVLLPRLARCGAASPPTELTPDAIAPWQRKARPDPRGCAALSPSQAARCCCCYCALAAESAARSARLNRSELTSPMQS